MFIKLKKGFIILKPNALSKDIFFSNAKIEKGSFAELISNDIYNALFSHTVDVFEEYDKYYKEEYDSINTFLNKRYRLNERDITEIMSSIENYKILYNSSEDNFIDMIFSEFMIDKIYKLMEV